MAKKSEEKGKKPLIEYDAKEIEKTVIELANAGQTPSEIGMTLRDQYGVQNAKKLTGMKIEAMLAKHGLRGDMPRDLLNLIRHSVVLQKHMEHNNKDQTARRGYTLAVSKIRRLTSYYQKSGKLDKGWRYTPETAALLVK
ncbi:MAG: 30S ribosomal protein S15 [Candidatus Diapherotrites archaeon]|uniref:30S ribosomal protein S15 n=1 Tax=Candidatus Iainarchaeum sp. TaxID=3101447 RepID=A0A8T3YKJ3_9ARCH|nr:30S ribosomal protein S15 [Candidatus Diapherotrites archaeon]